MNAEEALRLLVEYAAYESKPRRHEDGGGTGRWAEFHRCPRAHRLRYIDGLRRTEQPDYFGIGSVVHTGLGFAAMGEVEGFKWTVKQALDALVAANLYPPDVMSEGSRLLGAYFGKWGTPNAGYGPKFEVLEVEHPVFSTSLGVKKFTARLDVLLETGFEGKTRLVVGDHKTMKGMPSADAEELADKFSTWPQFLANCYCVREIEGETPLLLVNMISKSQIPGFRRLLVELTDEQIDRWAENHRVGMSRGTYDDWMNFASCYPAMGSPCWALKWCHGTDEEKQKLFVLPKRKEQRNAATANARATEST